MHTKESLIGLVIFILFAGGAFYLYERAPWPSNTTPNTNIVTTTDNTAVATTVEEQANAVLLALKNKDGVALSTLVSPTKGVRFSPYGHISSSTDIVLMATGLPEIYTEGKKEIWGTYDGSGAPIELTFTDYAKKFLYDEDFINAPQKATNQQLGHGNTNVNIADVYPGDTFVEYYFPGFDPSTQGMDWKSLRLIFEQVGNSWYLVGISHDQWTI